MWNAELKGNAREGLREEMNIQYRTRNVQCPMKCRIQNAARVSGHRGVIMSKFQIKINKKEA
jgi:hypothetical protein